MHTSGDRGASWIYANAMSEVGAFASCPGTASSAPFDANVNIFAPCRLVWVRIRRPGASPREWASPSSHALPTQPSYFCRFPLSHVIRTILGTSAVAPPPNHPRSSGATDSIVCCHAAAPCVEPPIRRPKSARRNSVHTSHGWKQGHDFFNFCCARM